MASHSKFVDAYVTETYSRTSKGTPIIPLPPDQTSDVSERSTERMNFRIKPRIKEAIQRAAALSGVDDSVFTMNAAYRSAIETIAEHERTNLRPVDHAAFFAALDSPPAPTGKLRAAFDRHRTTIISR